MVNLGNLMIWGVYGWIAFTVGKMIWQSKVLQKAYDFVTDGVDKIKERRRRGKSWLRF